MADRPPRDPSIAESQAEAVDAPRERKPEGAADSLDAGWGEASDEPPPPPIQPTPILLAQTAPPESPSPQPVVEAAPPPPAVEAAPPPPAVDVPPPPAYMMAVVEQVLSQSRPPPADPGPANAPREPRAPIAEAPPPQALLGDAPPPEAPSADAPPSEAPSVDGVSPALVVPVAEAPRDAVAATGPAMVAPRAELAPRRKKTVPIWFVVLGLVALAVLAAVDVAILALRSKSPHATVSTSTPEPVNVASASAAPPAVVTAPSATSSSPPLPSASAVLANEPPVALAAPSASVVPSASAAAEPASSVDPKTGARRASYLTISRAAAKHYVFLDGKMLLGTGPRTFPVKCGEHTLAIDDRNVARAITVACGGEYIVTN